MLDISKYSYLTDKNDYIAYEYSCIMKKLLILIVLALFLLSGCFHGSVRSSLNDVESYIMNRPDSALVVLESMDMDIVKSNRDRAHHALLHAMALDKNYIDVDDDSLARIAVDYYSRRGPKKYEARALYYLGIAYYYKGDYNKAILEFTKAEKVVTKSDSLYLGLIHLNQSNAYNATYNNTEEWNYAKKAHDVFSKLQHDYYLQVAALRMARAYFNCDEYQKSDEILVELISDTTTYNNVYLSAKVAYAYSKSVSTDSDYNESSSIYEEVYKEYDGLYMSVKDYWAWAYSLNKIGNYEESESLVEILEKENNTDISWYWKYLIEKSNNNSINALEYLEKSIPYDNKIVSTALKQSLSSVQRDYYIAQSENAEYKAKNRILITITCVSLAVLAICLILWISLRRIKQYQEEKEKYLQYANEIRLQLEASKKDDYPALKKRYVELYKSKFEMIGSLYEQYSLSFGKKNAEHSIYEKVAGIVKSFSNDYINSKLMEEMLDDGLDGIMTNIRNEVPELHEKDYMVFRLMAVGFDVTTISHLMNTTMNSIYIRKSRIKSNIEATDPEHKDQFLSVFS